MYEPSPLPAQAMDWLRLWRLLQQSSLRFHRLLEAFPGRDRHCLPVRRHGVLPA